MIAMAESDKGMCYRVMRALSGYAVRFPAGTIVPLEIAERWPNLRALLATGSLRAAAIPKEGGMSESNFDALMVEEAALNDLEAAAKKKEAPKAAVVVDEVKTAPDAPETAQVVVDEPAELPPAVLPDPAGEADHDEAAEGAPGAPSEEPKTVEVKPVVARRKNKKTTA